MLQVQDRAPGHALVQQVFRLQQTVEPRVGWQRVLGLSPLHPEAKPWYVGAVGEIEVGRLLAALPPEWTVLHSVPLSTRGTDVDHIAIGLGGVFTGNTKHHRGAKVWVAGRTMLVNKQKTDYVMKAEAEAKRVQRHLGAFPLLRVRPVIAVLGSKDLTVKSAHTDVAVRRAERLARWLGRRPAVLDDEQRAAVAATLTADEAWAMPPGELDVDPGWFPALRREVEAARVRRMTSTFLGLVLAAPVFLFVVEHLVPPLDTAIFEMLLPQR